MKKAFLVAVCAVGAGAMVLAAEDGKPRADSHTHATPKPRTAEHEPAKKGAPRNLLPNGSFEKGKRGLEGWQRPDGLTTFWVSRPDGPKGQKCLMIDTDVYETEVKQWQEALKENPNARPPRKTPTSGPKYDTIGGTYGVPFWSQPIPVRKGAAYRISAEMKGASAGDVFPKVFVKGFTDIKGRERKVYEFYLACRNSTGRWQTYTSKPFHPSRTIGRAPSADRMKVMVYAYWPPGAYYFDNIRIEEVPDEDGD